MSENKEHPFYGSHILREREQAYVNSLLKQYRHLPATEELKKTIYDLLQKEKHLGNLKIPFKVVLRKDPQENSPPYVEVILDTKV